MSKRYLEVSVAVARWMICLAIEVVLSATIAHRAYQPRFVAVAILLAATFALAFVPLAAWATLVRIAGHAIPRLGAVGFVLLLVIGTAPDVSFPAAIPIRDQASRASRNLGESPDTLPLSFSQTMASLGAQGPRALQQPLDKAIAEVRKVVAEFQVRGEEFLGSRF
jgi:hypothetical protein